VGGLLYADDLMLNGCRHSFGSYRMVDIKNIYQVAEEMCNSPAMAKKHYFQAVTNALRIFFMIF